MLFISPVEKHWSCSGGSLWNDTSLTNLVSWSIVQATSQLTNTIFLYLSTLFWVNAVSNSNKYCSFSREPQIKTKNHQHKNNKRFSLNHRALPTLVDAKGIITQQHVCTWIYVDLGHVLTRNSQPIILIFLTMKAIQNNLLFIAFVVQTILNIFLWCYSFCSLWKYKHLKCTFHMFKNCIYVISLHFQSDLRIKPLHKHYRCLSLTYMHCVLTYLALSYSLFPRTRHHFQFSVVGQVGKPPLQRKVHISPLKPVKSWWQRKGKWAWWDNQISIITTKYGEHQ